MNNSHVSAFWDRIDAILIINLAHRPDRYEPLYAKLDEIGVANKVHRIDAVAGKSLPGFKERPWFRSKTPDRVSNMKGGSAGCCLSQRKVMEYAKKNGFQTILMLEDDALFRNDLKGRRGDMIAEVLKQDDTWDMIYLGYYQRLNKHYVAKSEEINGKNFELWRIRGPLMNHAIVINHRVIDKWLEQLPTEKNIWSWMTYWGSIDSWVYNKFGRDVNVKIWGPTPHLVVQNPNESDIVGRKLSAEESEGTHRTSKLISLDMAAFERALDLSIGEKIYQTLKRSSRVVRAYLFGYKKT